MARTPSPPAKDCPADQLNRLGAVAMRRVWLFGTPRERCLIFGSWLGSIIASIVFGLATVILNWSGLPIDFGGVQVFISLYPPLVICQFWALCFGWWWGAIPAYLAAFSLSVYAGMPIGWALLFACANPLGFAVLTLGYRALNISRDLRSLSAGLFYVQLCFVASVFSSASALIWSYTNRIDSLGQLPIWQGWWLGGFVQDVLVVAPLLFLFWPAIERWRLQRPELQLADVTDSRRLVLRLMLAVVSGVLGYGFLTIQLGSGKVSSALLAGEVSMLPAAVGIMMSTTWTFFWVFALIVAFVGFFGYQLFTHWLDENTLLVSRLEQANLELEVLSRTDGLTGLYNRAATDRLLQEAWQRASRLDENACVMMLDIDHFKHINDSYGHAVGDAVITQLANVLRSVVRIIDVVGRYGGEEFVVILPGTDAPGACQLAERMREHIAANGVEGADGPICFSVSIGVAELQLNDNDAAAWLKRADGALYCAKHAGRDRVMLAQVCDPLAEEQLRPETN
ncbi:sensor domain-containing diguanylate cyclase [Andreprevotia chitinilytica]|uniref:sensor domain-containing diguanylate cyclase n=1 Tax=Andreprevotia chitinilytica TaxID=396808 RepID=UPI000689B5E5|nr:diguanylate cyclase [Andreprevotia chitinilytica]